MKLDSLLEASTPRRAWNGKLAKVDALMAWMYDKDILTKTEKEQKDKIFYAYYRFYNDGDMPKALQLKGFGKYSSKQATEQVIEEYLEAFIKKMLSKYLPSIDRAEFRIDKAIKDLVPVIDTAKRHDVHALLNYWLKVVKLKPEEGVVLKDMVDKLKLQYDALTKDVDAASPATSNITMTSRKQKMEEEKTWTKDFSKSWSTVCETMDDICRFLENLLDGLKKVKAQRLLGDADKLSEGQAKVKFTKITYEEFESLANGSDDYETTEVNGKSIMYAMEGSNIIGAYYRGKKFGTKCTDSKFTDITDYVEADTFWPYN